MPLIAVSDASALIALEQIGLLARLAPLFTELTIPPAVAREISRTVVSPPPWIIERPLTRRFVPPPHVTSRLGSGEIETIALALELGGYRVILDDRPARAYAVTKGLSVIGTIGILLAAKRQALIPAVRPSIEALTDAQFFLSPRLLRAVLVEAGEAE